MLHQCCFPGTWFANQEHIMLHHFGIQKDAPGITVGLGEIADPVKSGHFIHIRTAHFNTADRNQSGRDGS